jgi:type III secretion system chaperone SycN
MPYRKILQEFERRLGISPRQHDRGPVTFDLQGLGSLTLETPGGESELIATLAAPLPPYDDSTLLAALKTCHPDRVRPFSLACGLARDSLLLVSRQDIAGLSAASVENQAIFLIGCAKDLGISGA